MTGNNPFKIIEPTEEAPQDMKEEMMGSVRSLVFILRLVQLFAADATAVALTQMKIDLDRPEEPRADDIN